LRILVPSYIRVLVQRRRRRTWRREGSIVDERLGREGRRVGRARGGRVGSGTVVEAWRRVVALIFGGVGLVVERGGRRRAVVDHRTGKGGKGRWS